MGKAELSGCKLWIASANLISAKIVACLQLHWSYILAQTLKPPTINETPKLIFFFRGTWFHTSLFDEIEAYALLNSCKVFVSCRATSTLVFFNIDFEIIRQIHCVMSEARLHRRRVLCSLSSCTQQRTWRYKYIADTRAHWTCQHLFSSKCNSVLSWILQRLRQAVQVLECPIEVFTRDFRPVCVSPWGRRNLRGVDWE